LEEFAINKFMSLIAKILPWLQVILSILLILSILMQRSAAGAGGALGGGESGGIVRTKRGFEKFLFYTTIVIAVLFALSAFTAVLL
jgi:protein translocase SecG subunit